MNLHPLMAEQMAATRMAERNGAAAAARTHRDPEVVIVRGKEHPPALRYRVGMLLISVGSRCLGIEGPRSFTDSCA
jgi:hypothetical protein